MSKFQTQHASTVAQNASDADLLIRLGIVLALRQRAGWQVVRLGVRHGVVKLAGVVPTIYDRQLIAAVTSHVAGVFRVNDELTVDEASNRQPATDTRTASNGDAAQTNTGSWRTAFQHLPALSESLEDILTGDPVNAAPTR